MRKLQTVLAGCGLGRAGVLQVRVYLLHVERDCAPLNEVYRPYFPCARQGARPSRSSWSRAAIRHPAPEYRRCARSLRCPSLHGSCRKPAGKDARASRLPKCDG